MNLFTHKSSKNAFLISILSLITLLMGMGTFSACNKSNACDIKASFVKDNNTTQRTAMVAFCVSKGINYKIDSSGILYEIIAPGNSAKPNLCETISMTYVGTLLNGTQFDAGTISYSLSQLIVGWQITVPMIGKGGHIKVVLPSSLGYGSAGQGPIPPNSPLYFDITLN